MRPLTIKFTLLFCLCGAGVVDAQDREWKVRMKNLPPEVQKTVTEQSQGAKIKGLSREIEQGKTFYEVELLVNGHTKDVLMDPSGAVVAIEEQVELAALPPAVKSAIEKQAGKRRILLVESVIKDGAVTYYEAHIKNRLRISEFKVRPDGQPAGK